MKILERLWATDTYEAFKHFDVYQMLETVRVGTINDIDTQQAHIIGKPIWLHVWARFMDLLTQQHLILEKDKMPTRRQYYEKDWILYLQCKGCGEFKSTDEFYKHKICFMWLSSICKDCNKKRWAEYHAEHRDEDNRKNRERRITKKDRINEKNREKYKVDQEFRKICSVRAKKRREENKETNSKHHHEYYIENKEMILNKNKAYYKQNKEMIYEKQRRYNDTHRDLINKSSSEWKKNNRDKMNISQQNLRAKRWYMYSKAHRLVEKKLKEIWLKREKCPMCLQEWLVVCHHPDYTKPYQIVPCCNLCHSQIHRNIIECPKPIDLLLVQNKNERITNCTNLWEVSLR